MINMKRMSFFILFMVVFLGQSQGLAAPNDVLVEEDFLDRSMIEETQTNAVVDTKKGQVYLPYSSGSQTMKVNEDGLIVLTEKGIQFYSFDGTDYIENPYLSHSFPDNPIALALSPVGYEHYIVDSDGNLNTYRFSNGNLFKDPSYFISGLSSALSVSKSKESLFVLDNQTVRVFKDTGEEFIEVSQLNIALSGIDNPIQIEVMGEDLVILDNDQNLHYFSYNSTTYTKDPVMSIAGVGTSMGTDLGTVFTIKNNRFEPYHYTGTELVKNEYLSLTHNGAMSVAGLEDDLRVFIRDESGITPYQFNGSRLEPMRRLEGISVAPSGYFSPRQVQSKMYTWEEETQRLYVELTSDLPIGTKIETFVDAGYGFIAVPDNHVVEFEYPITSVAFKAVLMTDHKKETPILHNVRIIDKSLSIEYLETSRIVREPEGNPSLPTTEPVNVMGGYNIDIRVLAPGASLVELEFSNGESVLMSATEEDYFIATHYFPEDFEGVIDVKVIAQDDLENIVDAFFPAHYLIGDNIMKNIRIYDLR